MKTRLLMSAACMAAVAVTSPLFGQTETVSTAAAEDGASAIQFAQPVQLEAEGVMIATEAPGYAAPAWHDMDGDGLKDLLVGQFAGGKINVFRNLGNGELAAGEWLEADGAVAEVPGVW
ncbi:MAG: VCBS repeat-containing protein [Planctomycetota bacterium]